MVYINNHASTAATSFIMVAIAAVLAVVAVARTCACPGPSWQPSIGLVQGCKYWILWYRFVLAMLMVAIALTQGSYVDSRQHKALLHPSKTHTFVVIIKVTGRQHPIAGMGEELNEQFHSNRRIQLK